MRPSEPQRLDFPISVSAAESDSIAGHLYPARAEPLGVTQVLIHGVSYDHRYWDAGVINGENYSYADYMTSRGFDVLAIDLPGTGDSSRPDGFAVTARMVAEAISGVVDHLRSGAVAESRGGESARSGAGAGAGRVCLVGHSMGANIAVFTQASRRCADAVVVTATGYLPSRPRQAWAPGVREALMADPYASVPAERRRAFYHPPGADPDVIDYDNRYLSTVVATGLWKDFAALVDDPASGVGQIDCSTLVQLGEHDPTLPGRFADQESACYASVPPSQLLTKRLANVGHCFNLHRDREEGWEQIAAFLTP